MKENQFIKVSDYLEYLNQFEIYAQKGNLFYRGQLSEYPNMIPSIDRRTDDFKREYDIYESNKVKNKNFLQNLAKMQHDGKPTRLLDFTTDPLVALFFATQSNTRGDSSIYLFIRPDSQGNSLAVKLSAFVATQRNRDIENIVSEFNKVSNESISIKQAKDILSIGTFIKPNTIFDKENRRMIAQKGTFAIPGNVIEDGKIVDIIPFDNEGSYEEIVIPFEYQGKIRNELKNKGYTSENLLGIPSEIVIYPGLKGDSFQKINSKYYPNPYSKYSETIECEKLMTIDEMEAIGYKIAIESKSDSVTIWFKRKNTDAGNNIVTLHWFYENVGLPYGWKGRKYNEFVLDEKYGTDYVVEDYFFKRTNHKFKHLSVNRNAMKVDISVELNDHSLLIKTNLLKGTKLFVSYQVNNGEERSSDLIIKGEFSSIDLGQNLKSCKVKGNITLIVSTLQDKNIVNKYGIDYENLTGDFIKRFDSKAMVTGNIEFEFPEKNT